MKLSDFAKIFTAAGVGLTLSVGSVAAVDATAISGVNVRSGPGIGFSRVDSLYGGEHVNITECRGTWCYVEHSGPDGWVSGHFLAASGGETGAHDSSGDAAAAAILGVIIGGILTGHATPPPAPAPLPYGPDTCSTGFVWRDAIPGDHVCVQPSRRTAAAHENAIAGSRVNPLGTYGPNTCQPGFVWREAYSGDVVCVTGARRTQVHQENTEGPSHRVAP